MSVFMKKTILFIITSFSFFILGWVLNDIRGESSISKNLDQNIPFIKEKPLSKYAIPALSTAEIEPGTIEPGMKLAETDKYVSYLFNLRFKPDFKNEKNLSGQLNIPSGKPGPYPLIVMLRGYIDQEMYKTGDGTRNAAKFFSENGFITIAPDFLGYGDSDEETGNIFETRFQTYTTVLALLKSLNDNFTFNWDKKNIFLWGHSNGGQVALTVLEITGNNYPTTLWAPVSAPFPYSVFYYTIDSEDGGKLIRSELAKIEKDYDLEPYNLVNFIDKINAPLIIHQGLSDEAVPVIWSDRLVSDLKEKDKDVTYYKYPETDHNMRPSWDQIIQRDLDFFNSYLNSKSN